MKDLPEGCVKLDSFFRDRGYDANEIDTEDPYTKVIIYFKEFRRINQNMMFRIELKFVMWIHDDPGGSYDGNHDLDFEEARLAVYNRRMELDLEMLQFDDGPYYLEDTEEPKLFGRQLIPLWSLAELETVEKILGGF
jgi:hypothetical protein